MMNIFIHYEGSSKERIYSLKLSFKMKTNELKEMTNTTDEQLDLINTFINNLKMN